MAWTFGDGLMYTPAMGRPRGSKNLYSGRDRFPTCYEVDTLTGCWNWTASRGSHGYGDFRRDGHQLAHRWAYATFNEPIPDGMWVLHRCDNKRCVNPDHLFLGSVDANNKDMVAKGRHYSKGKTFEDVYGEEEAAKKKERLSRLRDGKPPLHAMPHSEDTKAAIAAIKNTVAAKADQSKRMKLLWQARRESNSRLMHQTEEWKAAQSAKMRLWWQKRREQ